MKKNVSEAPQLELPLIDEDCESGGTEKSTHIEEIIKQDPKKVKTVNFDVNLVQVKNEKKSFYIK